MKIVIRPPNINVVIKTTTKVELTIRLALGESDSLIYKLKANAIAPNNPYKHVSLTSNATTIPN